jgi:hypothetical protein
VRFLKGKNWVNSPLLRIEFTVGGDDILGIVEVEIKGADVVVERSN